MAGRHAKERGGGSADPHEDSGRGGGCLPSSAQHRAWESATPFETPPSDGEGKTADGSRGRGGVRGASRTADEANRERGCRFGSTGTKGGGRRGPNMGRFGSGALRSQLATRQQSCDGRGSEATEDGQAATDPDRPDVPPRAPPRHQTTRASSRTRAATRARAAGRRAAGAARTSRWSSTSGPGEVMTQSEMRPREERRR